MPGQPKNVSASKIIPHLWFDGKAVAAAKAYASIFPHSKVENTYSMPADSPSGPGESVEVAEFRLFQQPFVAFDGGPIFKINPAISFIVNFDPLLFGSDDPRDKDVRRKIDEVWEKLSDGGKVLMPIDKYPFSERYGWIQDKYGLSWQLMLTDPDGDPRPAIIPSLLFTEQHAGAAEDAINLYTSVFRNTERGTTVRYDATQPPEKAGTVMFGDFKIENQWFAAMDSAREHGFVFTEAVSFMVNCADQKEIDYYWGKLSAVRESEQCGWLKDRHGVSWQIAPARLREMMTDPDRRRAKAVMEAFMPMKKLDIAALEEAYAGAEVEGRARSRERTLI